MQIHLEGTEILNLQRERVFGLLTDARFLAESLPDAQEARVMDDGSVEAKMRIGISFLTTTMATKLRIEDVFQPHRARLLVEGSGSGSSIRITSEFELEGENPTKMRWVADAEISGVMAGMGSGVMKGFAQKKVAEIFRDIKKAMEKAPV